MHKITTRVLIEDPSLFSFDEVCHLYHIPKELLTDLIEYGLFNNQTTQIEQITFDQKALKKMETAFRLHHDLEINLSGVVLTIELLEEIDKLRDELGILRKHF